MTTQNPPKNAPASSLRELRIRLERSRRRLQASRSVAAGAFGLWLGALAACIIVGSRFAFGGAEPVPLIAALLIGAVAMAVGLARVFLTRPSLLELARRAERQEGLHERLSTAMEVAEQVQESHLQPSVLTEALLRQVSASAERVVEPQRLVERSLLREAFAVAAPALLILATFALPQIPTNPSDAPVSDETFVSEGSQLRDAATTDLRRTAELVRRRADERDDPYLHAVAEAIGELERLVASEAATLDEAEREIGKLLDSVARTYGVERPTLPPTFGDRQPSGSTGDSDPDGISSADVSAPLTASPERRGAVTDDSESARAAFSALLEELGDSAVATREEPPPTGAARNAPSPLEGQARADITGYDTQEDWQQFRHQMQFLERLGAQAGQSIGAAQQSSRGDSDRAGEGSQELTDSDEPINTNDGDQTSMIEVELPDAVRSSGRSITLELAPEAQRSAVTEDDLATGRRWQQGEEVPVDRQTFSLSHLSVLSRYFLPESESQTGTSQ